MAGRGHDLAHEVAPGVDEVDLPGRALRPAGVVVAGPKDAEIKRVTPGSQGDRLRGIPGGLSQGPRGEKGGAREEGSKCDSARARGLHGKDEKNNNGN